MNSKLIGGTLLVVGTTIGAGVLALPVATAQLGFLGSLVLLISAWAIMTASAFLFLEVNLWLPPKSNLISMAGATLGKPGQVIAWLVYLLLLYSIMCAYIAGGGDLFHYILNGLGVAISLSASAVLFTLLFGLIVYFGIRSVDYVNRGLMFGKMGAFILLIILIFPFITSNNVLNGDMQHFFSPNSITVVTVAFGSLLIIPSLRTYFGDDVKTLRKAVFIGMLIPLICYIAWDLVILGVIPLQGEHGWEQMMNSASSNSDLLRSLTTLLNKDSITTIAKFFTSICMATSFLSVSLSLSDFLSDGLRIPKRGKGGFIIAAAMFLPPVTIVLFYPNAFIRGLNYAGICCFILMILMPPLMAWRGRYHHELATDTPHQVRGGKFILALLVLFGTLMVGFGVEGVM
jgi:tyrosine-specific transport protein